jgi:hypothetical protein
MSERPVVFGYLAQLTLMEDPHVVESLSQRAKDRGRSLEEEVRQALRYWLSAGKGVGSSG